MPDQVNKWKEELDDIIVGLRVTDTLSDTKMDWLKRKILARDRKIVQSILEPLEKSNQIIKETFRDEKCDHSVNVCFCDIWNQLEANDQAIKIGEGYL